jgi:hypothetical protein
MRARVSDFDPRFDPAFQPGYDPARHPKSPAARKGPLRQTQQPDDFVPGADTAVRPTEVHPLEPAPIESAAPVSSVTRNPLLIALWIISVALVAAGLYGLRLIADDVTKLGQSRGFGGPEYFLLQSYTILAPLLIVLGIATAIGTLFLLAARRR